MQARQTVEADNKDKAKKIAQLQDFVARFAAGQRSSQVQSRKKEIKRLAPQELKRSNIQRPFIRFEQEKAIGREILIAKGLTKGFDGKTLFKDLDLEIFRGDKVAIIGANGVGKTTLLRTLMGELEPDAGTIKWGDSATWSYYPQDYHEDIKPGSTALDWLMQYMKDEGHQFVRGLLGRMLFSGDESLKATEAPFWRRVCSSSYGAYDDAKKSNFVLDEPTNHLDLEAVSALAEGLSIFPGTVFIVTHDRDLISDVATRVLSFTPKGVVNFLGNYDEYLQSHKFKEPAKKGK